MWQAISNLLRDLHTEAAEIELRNELPGGEIHAAWHLRFGGRDYFVKCDERELLPIFTAEADQLELLSRSKTVNVPQVFAVGSDRDYSFLVMEYLPPRPLDAHNAFLLGQQIAHLHQWSDQPQFGLDFDNDLSTTPQPNAWQRRWSTFFAEQRIGWQLELAAEKGLQRGEHRVDRHPQLLGLLAAGMRLLELLDHAGALLFRVVEFGEGVAEFPGVAIGLEAFDQAVGPWGVGDHTGFGVDHQTIANQLARTLGELDGVGNRDPVDREVGRVTIGDVDADGRLTQDGATAHRDQPVDLVGQALAGSVRAGGGRVRNPDETDEGRHDGENGDLGSVWPQHGCQSPTGTGAHRRRVAR